MGTFTIVMLAGVAVVAAVFLIMIAAQLLKIEKSVDAAVQVVEQHLKRPPVKK